MKKFIFGLCIVVFTIVLSGVVVLTENETTQPYALRPSIEVINWNGHIVNIKFPYQDYRYIIDYANPYEYIETEAGYDLVIHFGRFEREEN